MFAYLVQGGFGTVFWLVSIAIAIFLAVIVAKIWNRFGLPRDYSVAVFVGVFMTCSTLMIGAYLEHQRSKIIADFNPDLLTQASVFTSFRNAPREYQFFLHGAALKDCKPFAWSYREMGYYELPPNIAINVLPVEWIEQCQIKRAS